MSTSFTIPGTSPGPCPCCSPPPAYTHMQVVVAGWTDCQCSDYRSITGNYLNFDFVTNVSTVTFDFDLDGAGNGHFAGLMSPPSAFSQTHQSYWPTLGNGCDHLNGGLLTSNITSAVYAAAYAVTSIDFNGYGHVFRWSGSALSADNQQTECTWSTGSGDGMWASVSSIGGSFTATLS